MTSQQLFEQFISSRASHPDYSESFTKCKDKQGNELEEYACHRIQQERLILKRALWQKAVEESSMIEEEN